MSLDTQSMASLFEPERNRVIREMCHEFSRKISMAEIKIAVDEAREEWYMASVKGEIENCESRYSYVFRAARHKLLNLLRRKEHEVSFSDVRKETERNGTPEWEPEAKEDAEAARGSKGDVRYLFKKLPKAWRKVMKLFWIDGYDITEIAELMHRSKGAIYDIKEKAEKRFEELGIKYLGYPPQQQPGQSKQK